MVRSLACMSPEGQVQILHSQHKYFTVNKLKDNKMEKLIKILKTIGFMTLVVGTTFGFLLSLIYYPFWLIGFIMMLVVINLGIDFYDSL